MLAVEPMKKTPTTQIARQIRDRRKLLKMTWYEVAKLAELSSQNTVKLIEEGGNVKIHTVQAVCEVLGLELDVRESE